MGGMSRLGIALALLVLTATGAAPAAVPAASSTPPPDLVIAAREYRASLANLLPFREDAVARARATLATRRELVERGLVARRDAEAALQALAAAEAALAATRAELTAAESMVVEAAAHEMLASLPPGKAGALTVTTALIRFHGGGEWTLARAANVERFFAERFGRALPVSALGQTPAHDRLGFDHRNALDVAVHPDSAEGQALMAWLRARGVSFLAFRGAVAGEATGAHVHIGEPSPRLTAPARRLIGYHPSR
jgi:hypothetical protein